ncbi:MAG TPA: SpoIIE family protein phosphatase, partial [Candidatus Atribacteria bacterium]|nr:SpoIIE family protein phosphatase [Candidatus Atribacteria bacterium]
GTTLTMAVFAHGLVYIAHIGDSRCYIIKGNEVRQITRDHSLVQELLDNGSITADEMSVHPNRNIITRALGTEETLKIDLFEETISEGDIVILCSDGLSNYVKLDEELSNISGDLPVCELVKELGAKALAAGSTDDITIVAARYTGCEKER